VASEATPRVLEASDAPLPTILPTPPIAAEPIPFVDWYAESTVPQPVRRAVITARIRSVVYFMQVYL
jgi:hypothetical protein